MAIAALGSLTLLGFADDLRAMGPAPRLLFETAAALTLTLVALDVPATAAGIGSALAGTLFVVASINAFNFMDGTNGISAATTIVGFGWFLWLGLRHDVVPLQLIAAALIAAAAVFLLWNARGALFLGDSGAYFLGGAIGLAGLSAISHSIPWWQAFAPLVLYGTDTGLTLLQRLSRGESPVEAHRDHIYQRVVANGVGPLQMAAISGVGTTVCCVASLAPNATLIVLAWLGCAGAYTLLPRITKPAPS